jgi:hypothetical protein
VEVEETAEAYVAQFLRIGYENLEQLFRPGPASLHGGRLEQFGIVKDGDHVSARAVLVHRDKRFRYQRHIWPPDFPLLIKLSLYIEHLRERLLLGRHPQDAGPDGTIEV